MTFPLKYALNNATVNNITLNRDQASMIIGLSTTDDGMINIELPRTVIDSKREGNLDDDFLVLIDGLQLDYLQRLNNDQLRTISIEFENGVGEIEVQGTEMFGIEPVLMNLVSQQLAAETTTYNQTSFADDIEKLTGADQLDTETDSLISNASGITMGPTIMDDRQASLFVKVDAPLLTLEGIRKEGHLFFSLFDTSSNQTIKFVTYEITIKNGSSPPDSRPLLRDFFHAPNGLLTVKVDPTESGPVQIFGDRDPFQNAIIADTGGTVNVRGPILTDGGLYHIEVRIFGIDNVRNIFLPEKAPRFEIKVTLQNNNNSNTIYQPVIRNNTNYQPIEPIFKDTVSTYSNYACGINVHYPANWNAVNASDDERSDSGAIVDFFPTQVTDSPTSENFAYLTIMMDDLISTKTLRGITIKNIDALKEIEPKVNLSESKLTHIGDLPAHQVIYTSGSDLEGEQNEVYKSLVMWTINDDKSYIFRFSSSDASTFDQRLPEAYNIINSTQITTPGEELTDDYTVTC